MKRVLHLMRKELLELQQDPRLFGIVILAPIIQLNVLGYAATTDVKDIPIAIVDADRSTASRELDPSLRGLRQLQDRRRCPGSTNEIDSYLDRGEAWMAISIPPDYGRKVGVGPADHDPARRRRHRLELDRRGDGLRADADRRLRPGSGRGGGARRSPSRRWCSPRSASGSTPRLESRDFMIPGIVALLLLVITTNLSAMAIVREKEIGTLEQLNVTPLARWELITGKLLPYAFIGIIDVVLVLIVAIYWFEVPMRGSIPLLFGMCLIYLLSTLGLGLFVSTISQTQQQAMMTTIFFFLMPMMYLSGFIFPIENMPAWIQPFTYLIPLRYFLVIVRGIFQKGIGLEILWPQALALFAWGAAVLTLATLRSSKRLG